jgi:hypothetical protein
MSGAPVAGHERELMLGLQERRADAMCRQDVTALGEMLDDSLVYIHANGSVDDKASFLELIQHPERRYLGIEYLDCQVLGLGDAGRVVTGRAELRLIRPGGQLGVLAVRYTTAYAWREGRWQLVVWQATSPPAAPGPGPVSDK